MKKYLIIFYLLLFMPLTKTLENIAWKNKPVENKIKEFFKKYFVYNTLGHADTYSISYDIAKELAVINFPNHPDDEKYKYAIYQRLINLVQRFFLNVAIEEPLNTRKKWVQDNSKAMGFTQKTIDQHNAEALKKRIEIKDLLTSPTNPLKTLGGLAALIYEYSDQDEKLKVFSRKIARYEDGYYKEYFIYGQKDEEKTTNNPYYFYRIKTQRPKGWLSFFGYGYVDKRKKRFFPIL